MLISSNPYSISDIGPVITKNSLGYVTTISYVAPANDFLTISPSDKASLTPIKIGEVQYNPLDDAPQIVSEYFKINKVVDGSDMTITLEVIDNDFFEISSIDSVSLLSFNQDKTAVSTVQVEVCAVFGGDGFYVEGISDLTGESIGPQLVSVPIPVGCSKQDVQIYDMAYDLNDVTIIPYLSVHGSILLDDTIEHAIIRVLPNLEKLNVSSSDFADDTLNDETYTMLVQTIDTTDIILEDRTTNMNTKETSFLEQSDTKNTMQQIIFYSSILLILAAIYLIVKNKIGGKHGK